MSSLTLVIDLSEEYDEPSQPPLPLPEPAQQPSILLLSSLKKEEEEPEEEEEEEEEEEKQEEQKEEEPEEEEQEEEEPEEEEQEEEEPEEEEEEQEEEEEEDKGEPPSKKPKPNEEEKEKEYLTFPEDLRILATKKELNVLESNPEQSSDFNRLLQSRKNHFNKKLASLSEERRKKIIETLKGSDITNNDQVEYLRKKFPRDNTSPENIDEYVKHISKKDDPLIRELNKNDDEEDNELMEQIEEIKKDPEKFKQFKKAPGVFLGENLVKFIKKIKKYTDELFTRQEKAKLIYRITRTRANEDAAVPEPELPREGKNLGEVFLKNIRSFDQIENPKLNEKIKTVKVTAGEKFAGSEYLFEEQEFEVSVPVRDKTRSCAEILTHILKNEYDMVTIMLEKPIEEVDSDEQIYLRNLQKFTSDLLQNESMSYTLPYHKVTTSDRLYYETIPSAAFGKNIGVPIPTRITKGTGYQAEVEEKIITEMFQEDDKLRMNLKYVKSWVEKIFPETYHEINPECWDEILDRLRLNADLYIQTNRDFLINQFQDIFDESWQYFLSEFIKIMRQYGMRGGYQWLEATYRLQEHILLRFYPPPSLEELVRFVRKKMRNLENYVLRGAYYVYDELQHLEPDNSGNLTLTELIKTVEESYISLEKEEENKFRSRILGYLMKNIPDEETQKVFKKFAFSNLKKDAQKFDNLKGELYYEFLETIVVNFKVLDKKECVMWKKFARFIGFVLNDVIDGLNNYIFRYKLSFENKEKTVVFDLKSLFTTNTFVEQTVSFNTLRRIVNNFEYFMRKLINISVQETCMNTRFRKIWNFVEARISTVKNFTNDTYESLFITNEDVLNTDILEQKKEKKEEEWTKEDHLQNFFNVLGDLEILYDSLLTDELLEIYLEDVPDTYLERKKKEKKKKQEEETQEKEQEKKEVVVILENEKENKTKEEIAVIPQKEKEKKKKQTTIEIYSSSSSDEEDEDVVIIEQASQYVRKENEKERHIKEELKRLAEFTPRKSRGSKTLLDALATAFNIPKDELQLNLLKFLVEKTRPTSSNFDSLYVLAHKAVKADALAPGNFADAVRNFPLFEKHDFTFIVEGMTKKQVSGYAGGQKYKFYYDDETGWIYKNEKEFSTQHCMRHKYCKNCNKKIKKNGKITSR
jgi:hypothetical protein